MRGQVLHRQQRGPNMSIRGFATLVYRAGLHSIHTQQEGGHCLLSPSGVSRCLTSQLNILLKYAHYFPQRF